MNKIDSDDTEFEYGNLSESNKFLPIIHYLIIIIIKKKKTDHFFTENPKLMCALSG
jgi:hypothetical protein